MQTHDGHITCKRTMATLHAGARWPLYMQAHDGHIACRRTMAQHTHGHSPSSSSALLSEGVSAASRLKPLPPLPIMGCARVGGGGCTCIHTHTFIHTYIHTYIHIQTHTHTHTHTRTRTHTYPHTQHTHTHARTHTPAQLHSLVPKGGDWPV